MVHEQIAQDLKEHPAKDGMVFNVLVTAVEIGAASNCFTSPGGWASMTWPAT